MARSRTASLGETAMCEIGKPIEIIDVEPLNPPAPLPRTKNEPERQPAVVPAAPVTETTLAEKV
jgi:hypothetical protein